MKCFAALCIAAAAVLLACTSAEDVGTIDLNNVLNAKECNTGIVPIACTGLCNQLCTSLKCTGGICKSNTTTVSCKCYNQQA